MRAQIVGSFTILAATTLAAYVLLGSNLARDAIPNAWGILRVACLLINIVTVPTLAALLARWASEFDQAQRTFRLALAVCVINGVLLIGFFLAFLLFVSP